MQTTKQSRFQITQKLCLMHYQGYQLVSELQKDYATSKYEEMPFMRLYSFLSPELTKMSRKPGYKGEKKYDYCCMDDFSEVQAIIEMAFAEVIGTQKVDFADVKTVEHAKNKIVKVIRHQAQGRINKWMKEKASTMIVTTEHYQRSTSSHTPEEALLKKEIQQIIEEEIDMYLKRQDELGKIIFLNQIMKGISIGKYDGGNISQARISRICSVHENTVNRRKKKILNEFRVIWNKKIRPLMEVG